MSGTKGTETTLDLETVLGILSEHRQDLENRGVSKIAVFGSFARGEAGPESDIDILIEFSRPVGLFEFIRLKHDLETILGRSVDLATPDSLKSRFRDRILREAVSAA